MANHIAGPLYWEQLGKQGVPIAFIHPNPMDCSCWLYQMAHLSTWFRTIGVDLPGYGRSPKADPEVTASDLAQACWEAVDEVTHDSAIVVGLSVGACVAAYMAQQAPERTLALVLTGTRYRRPSQGSAGRRIARYREEGIAHRYEHTIEDFRPAFRETDLAHYFAGIFRDRDPWLDLESILAVQSVPADPEPDWLFDGIQAPTLVICGSEDPNVASCQELTTKIRDCEVATIEGAGHACNMERPWEWDAVFLDFVRRHGLVDAHLSTTTDGAAEARPEGVGAR